jgi:hypothetical protein
MMIYKNPTDLCRAHHEWQMDPTADKTVGTELTRLLKVYYYAYCNPPEGVIGVGCITYAEQKLVEAQQ